MKKRKRINVTTQYIIVICAFLLLVSGLLGAILTQKSGKTIKTLIRQHMLSVADTAADAVDGDELGALTADDVGSPAFNHVADTLTAIKELQKNSDIKYIYAIKKNDAGDGYVFTVDPDPERPAPYGYPVVKTPAQDVAWAGTSEVDSEKFQDEWGDFYSAWSPVKDSSGKVVGVIGVDFAAKWYDQLIKSNTQILVIVGAISLILCGIVLLLLTGQFRRRFNSLNNELSALACDVQELSDEISSHPGYEEEPEKVTVEVDTDSDAIETLSERIRAMQKKLHSYIAYVHVQAYTDTMTGVGNKTAYLDRVKGLNDEIKNGSADFAVAVFDINGLKKTNDFFGHECGDMIITDAAALIRRVFSKEQVYRIGGDEFIALLGPTTEEEIAKRFEQLEQEIAHFNAVEKEYAMVLSFSYGAAVHKPGDDENFKDVFRRADEAMYRNKGEYYKQFGDRRKADSAPRDV